MTLGGIQKELQRYASPAKAKILRGFFKAEPGEYGEGDIFIGVQVPAVREVANEFQDLPMAKIVRLLKSKIHEERLTALLILVIRFAKGNEAERARVFKLYLQHARHINNWDLVDLSAAKIVGTFLADRPKDVLYRLANSSSLWERRIAIVSTFHFIRQNKFADTLKIAKILLYDKEDLIHKAVGWMLREVGKRDQICEERFLAKHYKGMPRTMLRYAIERFSESKRQAYLQGKA
ncbi:MAG TPA: DNA alkylation repair protein [Candidatus Omnitrophota bacterium]|nr:DNA alkylation repair protein [Candidatus Omnitrophota bacterium]HQL41761.1 DNA alkylation repair protein [Candidatus Omnitrophota bacterium]